MRCAECHLAIPFYDEDITIHVVYSDGRPIRRLCHHVDFDETDPAIVALLGSGIVRKNGSAKTNKPRERQWQLRD